MSALPVSAPGEDMYDVEIAHDDLLPCVREGRTNLYMKHLAVWRTDLSDDLRRCMPLLCLILTPSHLASFYLFLMLLLKLLSGFT